ncbi:glycosyltransferase [Rhizobium sp. BK661]|uniref:glycosyltransferase family 2 protein n=1 Tax=Rhizobium sp. BK661 TaxID=2586991 RepID=UPI002166C9E6|nr:glycosyltransferase [Rhizobium sp. BK661]MCS3742194.1 glycosyltransferase involved in cell wall biosynthesis [Rhizobium sp. BK661]
MPPNIPLISIIITCFNYELYIRECIKSAMQQDYPNLEIIVVDDGSSDRSWDIIQEYRDHVTCVRQKNRGALRSSLTGFSLSNGDFVHFLDADDLLEFGALQQVAPYLQPDVSKVQFMLSPIDKEGKVIGDPFPKLAHSKESGPLIHSINQRGYYNTPPTSGNIYRRDIYENLGDLSYERAIDGVPYLLAPFVGKVVSLDLPLGKYRIHNANLSSFSTLTSERLNGYMDRFLARLRHLSQLIDERGLKGKIRLRQDYAYVREMMILSTVASGKRPSFPLLTSYVSAVRREHGSILRTCISLVFALGLFVLPDVGRRQLASFRLDPSRLWRLRSRLKNAVSVGT